MNELPPDILEQISDAAQEADFLPSDHINIETKHELIGEKLQELWEGMSEIALNSGELKKYKILNRVVHKISSKEIGFGFYNEDEDFMNSLDGRFGMAVTPVDEDKATVAILVHTSIWGDLTTDQREEDLVNHMWNVFEVIDYQTNKLKREGKFASFKTYN